VKTPIVLDAMGGDNAPAAVIDGAVQAARAFPVEIILVGRQEVIEQELARHDTQGLSLPIVHASEVVEMTDHTMAVKEKKDASMVVGVRLVKEGKAEAFVTMGNSGGAMAAALFGLGRIRGIERPALGSVYPTATGWCFILDIGANTEVKPEYLYQFALMGAAYAEKVMGIARPRVALLSNGEEEGKGTQIVRDAYDLLKKGPVNFVGNAEGKDVPKGLADVVVTDGFTGNVLIKLSEGLAETLIGFLKGEIKKRPLAVAGAMLAKPAFDALKRRLDYAEFGGGILLGVEGNVIVGHGRSNARAVRNAIRVAAQTVDQKLVGTIREAVSSKQ